jgi:hypothetical protein
MEQDEAYWRDASDKAGSKELALTAFGIYAGLRMARDPENRRTDMSNFENELRALVDEWLKRGDDPVRMIDALNEEANRLPHPADTGPINDS